jgi:DNA-binding transcriptional MerR regulator
MLWAMYRIGELSRLSGVPIRTLRYYDQIGLLVPAEVSHSGYRSYGTAELEQLNRILVLKDLGCSLDEIRAMIADRATADDLRALIRRKHAELEDRVELERHRLARAAARLETLERAEIAVRTTAPHWVASVRDTLRAHDDCDRLFDELGHHLRRGTRQRGAIWHTCGRGRIDCEVFEILPGPIAPRGRVQVRQLPAQRVAALIYHGDVDYLSSYRAMRAWITRSGLEVTDAKRELFLRGETSVTEIQFPIGRPAPARSPS